MHVVGVKLIVGKQLVREIRLDDIPGRGGVTRSQDVRAQQALNDLLDAVFEHCAGKPYTDHALTPEEYEAA